MAVKSLGEGGFIDIVDVNERLLVKPAPTNIVVNLWNQWGRVYRYCRCEWKIVRKTRPYLTYLALQPIHLVCVDERTHNLFVLAGTDEDIEAKIARNG